MIIAFVQNTTSRQKPLPTQLDIINRLNCEPLETLSYLLLIKFNTLRELSIY